MTLELFKREIEEKKVQFDIQLRNQTASFEQSLADVKVEQSSVQGSTIELE